MLDVRKFKAQAVPRHRSSTTAKEPSLQIAPLLWLAFWLKVHLDFNLA